MSTWKYRYNHVDSTEIHEGFLEITDDDDRLSVIKRVQELRILLHSKNKQFIDAGPINGAEKSMADKLSKFKKFKKPVRVKPFHRSFPWLFLGLLLLFVLLWILVNL